MATEFKHVQLRIKQRCIIAEGSGGQIFYATPKRARLLIDAGAVELLNTAAVKRGLERFAAAGPVVGPEEQPAAGPSEFKVEKFAEKKSSAAVPDGHSTDSASSSAPGTAALSSVSAAALVSPQRRSPRSPRRARRVVDGSE